MSSRRLGLRDAENKQGKFITTHVRERVTFRAREIDLLVTQMNPCFGLATALEALHDLPGALGATRTYVHRSPEGDPFVRKAHRAIWE